jgi:hypothetical protein
MYNLVTFMKLCYGSHNSMMTSQSKTSGFWVIISLACKLINMAWSVGDGQIALLDAQDKYILKLDR